MRSSALALLFVLSLAAQYSPPGGGGSGTGTVTTSGTPTTNQIPKFTASTVIGNSSLSDNGTVSTTEPILAPIINGVSYSNLYTGATVDVRVNACISDAENLANGNTTHICDASGETGAQTVAAQITVGTSAGLPVVLRVPASGSWKGTMTDGTSCTVLQWGNTAILGVDPPAGTDNTFYFGAGSSSNLNSVYCWLPTSSSGLNYTYDQGFGVTNTTGTSGHVTASGFTAQLGGSGAETYDTTTWDHVTFFGDLDATVVRAYNLSCSTTFNGVTINGNYVSQPLLVFSDNSGGMVGFNINNSTVGHPGTGKNIVVIQDTSTSHSSSQNLTNLYMETSNSDTTTALIKIDGAGVVNLKNINFRAEVASSAAYGVSVTNTSTATVLNAQGLNFSNGSGDFFYPSSAITNAISGENIASDAVGNLEYYSNSLSHFLPALVLSKTVTGTFTSKAAIDFVSGFRATGYGSNSTTLGGVILAGQSSTGTTVNYLNCSGTTSAATCNLAGTVPLLGAFGGSETIASSATPTFTNHTNASINTLTANVTSFTLAAGQDGQMKTLTFCQNATGSFTVTPPANVHGFFTVGATASKCNTQSFVYSVGQTAWLAVNSGQTNQ